MTPRPASERLRELAAKQKELVNAKPAPGENAAVDYLGPLANLAGDYARLLDPLIADVVEAAEWCSTESANNDIGRLRRLTSNMRVPLTALREALEEEK